MQDFRPEPTLDVRIVGRYALYGKLATGGMATVHFGRLLGPVGFSRTVAIKRLHPQFAKDPEFVTMFLDEARLAARIQHPNVVATLDVVALEEELLLVMDYVRGEAFSRLLRTARKRNLELPLPFIATIISGMLQGLHAAHEATDERGQPLRVVHRDISPQNVLVGVDGTPRLLDFGVAKAGARAQVTRDGQVKGKLSYMSPEQLQGRPVDRRADIFAASVVLWEALTGKRLFLADDTQEIIRRIVDEPVPPPSALRPGLPAVFDKIVARGLEKNPDARYSTAREFAVALEHGVDMMSAREVGEWVEEIAGDVLERREQALAELESYSSVTDLSPPSAPEHADLSKLLRPSGSFAVPSAPRRSLVPTPSAPRRPPPSRPPSSSPAASSGPSRPPLPPRKPLSSSDLLDDDPTTVRDSFASPPPSSAAGAAPSSQVRPSLPQSGVLAVPQEAAPAFSFLEVTGPAVRIEAPLEQESDLDPFGRHKQKRRALVWAGAAVAALAVIWSLWPNDSPSPEVVNVVNTAKPAVTGDVSSPDPAKGHAADDAERETEGFIGATAEVPVVAEAPESAKPVPQAPRATWRPAPRYVAPTPAPTATVKPPACQQPWKVDADGIRRIKPECL